MDIRTELLWDIYSWVSQKPHFDWWKIISDWKRSLKMSSDLTPCHPGKFEQFHSVVIPLNPHIGWSINQHRWKYNYFTICYGQRAINNKSQMHRIRFFVASHNARAVERSLLIRIRFYGSLISKYDIKLQYCSCQLDVFLQLNYRCKWYTAEELVLLELQQPSLNLSDKFWKISKVWTDLKRIRPKNFVVKLMCH